MTLSRNLDKVGLLVVLFPPPMCNKQAIARPLTVLTYVCFFPFSRSEVVPSVLRNHLSFPRVVK